MSPEGVFLLLLIVAGLVGLNAYLAARLLLLKIRSARRKDR